MPLAVGSTASANVMLTVPGASARTAPAAGAELTYFACAEATLDVAISRLSITTGTNVSKSIGVAIRRTVHDDIKATLDERTISACSRYHRQTMHSNTPKHH